MLIVNALPSLCTVVFVQLYNMLYTTMSMGINVSMVCAHIVRLLVSFI